MDITLSLSLSLSLLHPYSTQILLYLNCHVSDRQLMSRYSEILQTNCSITRNFSDTQNTDNYNTK